MRKRGGVKDRLGQVEPTEPSEEQVEVELLDELPHAAHQIDTPEH